jgi:ribosomal protein L16 Arg81 hydroxylase
MGWMSLLFTRQLEVAKTKLSRLEQLARQVQDHASQIARHKSEKRDTEAAVISQDELDGLAAMLEDYIGKLTKKREEFDELVEEQRHMLEIVKGSGSWKEKHDTSGVERQPSKGIVFSSF